MKKLTAAQHRAYQETRALLGTETGPVVDVPRRRERRLADLTDVKRLLSAATKARNPDGVLIETGFASIDPPQLATRIVRALRKAGVITVDDVAVLFDSQLLNIPRLGEASVRAIRRVVPFRNDLLHNLAITIRMAEHAIATRQSLDAVKSLTLPPRWAQTTGHPWPTSSRFPALTPAVPPPNRPNCR
jgi:predicted DNA-binding helix-hairpin-helix protein